MYNQVGNPEDQISHDADHLFSYTDGSLDDEEEKEEQETDISEKQRHQLKHRELFLSRQVETMPATHIRGKCVVTLLNETELLTSYLNKEVSSCIAEEEIRCVVDDNFG